MSKRAADATAGGDAARAKAAEAAAGGGAAAAAAAASAFDDDDLLCVRTLRVLGAELPQTANSGHPGAPIGMAPLAHVLWSRHLRFDPAAPEWLARDRFVLSNGHACALLYSLLHISGFEAFSVEQLRQFRQPNSLTPGHPECHQHGRGRIGGIEVTTGPLGQGIAMAVGLAVAERHLAATYNRDGCAPVVDNYTYVLAGDGCMQEGVASEACSLAGHLGLGRLVVLYDDNDITIDGGTALSFSEDVGKRFEAYGWHVQRVADGDSDLDAISAAIDAAKRETERPSLVCVRTTIGLDTKVAGTQKAHGSPIGADDLAALKRRYGFDPAASFVVPDAVRARYARTRSANAALRAAYAEARAAHAAAHPAAAAELAAREAAGADADALLPADWRALLPRGDEPERDAAAGTATRKLSYAVLEALVPKATALIGGSADLTPSTLTRTPSDVDFQRATPHGRYLRFGVREHAMAAVCNGLYAYQCGATVPFCATFLNFLQYCLPAVRLSAISSFGVVYIMTHDSIGLGEDGPTHQPINAMACVRSMPNALLLRPADRNEVAAAYERALAERERPSVLCLTRQTVPQLAGSSYEGARRGGYVLVKEQAAGGGGGGGGGDKPQLLLIGTGSELHLCVGAAEQLRADGLRVRVVSLPCWELFDEQDAAYRADVLAGGGVPTLSVEAAAPTGWERYAHASIGMRTFGASGPYEAVLEQFGFTVANVAKRGKALVDFYAGAAAPDLVKRFDVDA